MVEILKASITLLPVDKIEEPYVAMHHEEDIEELVRSIKAQGLIHPIVVKRLNGRYRCIVGYRRLLACRKAGMRVVPAIVCEVDDRAALIMSLIENIQRKDIDVLTEANTYLMLREYYGLTEKEIAAMIGKSPSYVSNRLRVLTEPEPLREALKKGLISFQHALELMTIREEGLKRRLLEEVIHHRYSVSKLRSLLRELKNNGNNKKLGKRVICWICNSRVPRKSVVKVPICFSCLKKYSEQVKVLRMPSYLQSA